MFITLPGIHPGSSGTFRRMLKLESQCYDTTVFVFHWFQVTNTIVLCTTPLDWRPKQYFLKMEKKKISNKIYTGILKANPEWSMNNLGLINLGLSFQRYLISGRYHRSSSCSAIIHPGLYAFCYLGGRQLLDVCLTCWRVFHFSATRLSWKSIQATNSPALTGFIGRLLTWFSVPYESQALIETSQVTV